MRIDNPDENGVGEIVARTPGMFAGYYKNEEASRADVRDGWMHTGDAGYFEQGATATWSSSTGSRTSPPRRTGARFSPMFIENKLKFSPYIAEAVILGHGRPWLAAIICIRFPIVSKWAEQRRIAFTNYTNLAGRPEVYELIRQRGREGQRDAARGAPHPQVPAALQGARRGRRRADAHPQGAARRHQRDATREIIDAVYGDRESVHVDTWITFQDGTKSRIVTDLAVAAVAGSASGHRRAAE